MRVVLPVALALFAITTLSAASSAYCATKADPAALSAHSKTNSFAPHAAAHSRVYGAPEGSASGRRHDSIKRFEDRVEFADAIARTPIAYGVSADW